MFKDKYPLLHHYLSQFTLDSGLDLVQIKGIVRRGIASQSSLADEITAALADESVSWKQVLNDPATGEGFAMESEESARAFARQMLEP
jgi:hypothetical protein